MVLQLREYRTRAGVELGSRELSAFRHHLPSVTVEPGPEEGRYDLTPGSVVGAVRVGDLQVEIHPKVGIARTLYLASVALDPGLWRDEPVAIDQGLGVFDAVAALYTATLRQALRGGLVHGYRARDEDLMTVRGRIAFGEQLRRRPGRWLPVACSFDEFTADTELNRVLLAALEILRAMPLRNAMVRRSVRDLLGAFIGVEPVRYHPRWLLELHFDRLNDRFRSAAGVARLILQHRSPELGGSTTPAQAFLIDMNQVFEDFVTVVLREELRADERSFPQNARGRRLRLDTAGRVRLEPDLSWWRPNGTCRFVGDLKYKYIEPRGIKHADLYQLLAYTIAADLPEGLLIYADGEVDKVAHMVVHAGKRLRVETVDLGGEVADLRAEMQALAAVVRSIARAPSVPAGELIGVR